MTPAERLAAYRRWHIDVVEVKRGGLSWQNHCRPRSTGAWGDMHADVTHHTGPFGSVPQMLALLWAGRSDLPGPLCHDSTAPNGTLYVVGHGRANHAGKGARNVYDALLADRRPPAPGADAVDFNAFTYGNEVMHPGDSSPYPHAQIQTAVRRSAAICEFHGWTAASAILHKGLTQRKPDWSFSGQPWFQDEVAHALSVGPDRYAFPKSRKPATTPRPKPEPVPVPAPTPDPIVQEDDMTFVIYQGQWYLAGNGHLIAVTRNIERTGDWRIVTVDDLTWSRLVKAYDVIPEAAK